MMRLPLFCSNESIPSMVQDRSDLDGFTLMNPSDMPPSHGIAKVVGHLRTLGNNNNNNNNNNKMENDIESILIPLDTGKYNGPLPTISLQPRLKKQRFIDTFHMDDNDDTGDDNDAQAESYEFRVHTTVTPRLTPDRSSNINLDTTESNSDEFRAPMPVLKRKRTVSEDSMVWPGETTTFVSPFPQTSLCAADSWTTPRPVSWEQQDDERSHKDDQQQQQQQRRRRRRRYRKSFHPDAREMTTTPRRLSKADQRCFFDVSPSEIQAFSLAFPILD